MTELLDPVLATIPPSISRARQCGARRAADDAAGPFAHEVIDSFECIEHLRSAWDALCVSLGSDIYATYDWCRIWWRHYGDGRTLRVHVFHQNERLCAVVPAFIEVRHLGPIRVRLARLVGCDHSVTTPAMSIEPGCLDRVIACVAESCRDAGCDAIHLGPLAGDDATVPHLPALLSATPFCVVRSVERHPHMVFDVPTSFDAYLEALSTKERRNLRRDERKLEDLGRVTHRVLQDADEVNARMERFIELHQQQWKAQGQLGHFDDWPGARAFHRELADCQHARGRLLFTEVSVNDSVVAMEYSYQLGERVSWILGARTDNATGRIGFAAMLRQAIERSARSIDALRGHYEYKRLLGAKCLAQRAIVAVRPGWLPRARLAGLTGWSMLWDKAYYRIWFSRLRPRLGLAGRSLRKSWIRTRM